MLTGAALLTQSSRHIGSAAEFSGRIQASKLKPDLLRDAVHDIQILHSLTRSAFHQVVDRADRHDPVVVRIAFKSNITKVGAGEVLGLGVSMRTRSILDHPDKWLILIRLSIAFPQGALIRKLVLGEYVTSRNDCL